MRVFSDGKRENRGAHNFLVVAGAECGTYGWLCDRNRPNVRADVKEVSLGTVATGACESGDAALAGPVSRFPDAAPLFEKERNSLFSALLANGGDPLPFHRPGANSAFTANNDPLYPLQIQLAQIFQKWFYR